jgi:hypothetical protein
MGYSGWRNAGNENHILIIMGSQCIKKWEPFTIPKTPDVLYGCYEDFSF